MKQYKLKKTILSAEEVVSSITIQDNYNNKEFQAFYDYTDVLDDAKERFLENHKANDVARYSARRFIIVKDSELFAYDYVEFEAGESKDDEAKKIFNNQEVIDFTDLSDDAVRFDYETCEQIN